MSLFSAGRRSSIFATYEATLVYYDEPQLMILSRDSKKKIIATAIAADFGEYPFFAAEISTEQWERYLREVSDLRYLFDYPRYKKWYLFDLSMLRDDNRVQLTAVERQNINPAYLPAGQFFARSHTEPLPIEQIDLGIEKFLIDGSWDFPDFSVFYGKVADIYAIFLSIARYGSESTERVVRGNIRHAYQRYPLKGGASYRFFYRDLINTQSILDRLNVDSIQYASPGHVDVHARSDIFGEIRASLANYRKNSETIARSYRDLRKYLSKAHLLTANAEGFDSKSPYSLHIQARTDTLCNALSFPYIGQIMELTGGNILASAKIILSFTRRLDKSFRFFAEGRVTFSSDVDDVRIDMTNYTPLSDDEDDEPLEEADTD